MHTKLPNINFFKNSSFFFVVWFLKNSRKSFWIRNFMANCLSRRDQKVHSIFFKNCASRGIKVSCSNGFKMKKGVFIEMNLLLTVITNSFQIQNQTFEKHFSFFSMTLWSWNLFLFRNISKIPNDKSIQNKFIHFMQILTSKQCLHFSKSTFTNENIHDQKTNKNCP